MRLAPRAQAASPALKTLSRTGHAPSLGGRIVDLTDAGMTLETPDGAETQMRLGPEPKLTRLESGGRDLLQPGASVLVKIGDTEADAAAVLVISPP